MHTPNGAVTNSLTKDKDEIKPIQWVTRDGIANATEPIYLLLSATFWCQRNTMPTALCIDPRNVEYIADDSLLLLITTWSGVAVVIWRLLRRCDGVACLSWHGEYENCNFHETYCPGRLLWHISIWCLICYNWLLKIMVSFRENVKWSNWRIHWSMI